MGKTKAPQPSGKDKKKAEKIAEDKTFGMKSKKSKKVQALVAQTKLAVTGMNKNAEHEFKAQQKKEKKKQLEEQMLLGYLKNTVLQDKKTAKKEKEEAIAAVEAINEENKYNEKTASINIYVDPREPDATRSTKVCDDFIEACEKYG